MFDRRKGYIINKFSVEGRFTYECHFSRNNSHTVTDILLLVKPLSYLEELSGGHTVVGEQLMLKCTVRSNTETQYKVTWTMPDQNGVTNGRISISETITTTLSSKTYYQELTINKTTLEDQGEYICVVEQKYQFNNVPETKHIKYITIYDKGEHFINLTEENDVYDISVLAGEPQVQWKIDVEAHPVPTLMWYNHNGKEIPAESSDSNKYKVSTEGFTATTLVITNITIQDQGVYQLKAINEFEEKVLNLSLTVTGKPIVQIRTANFHMINEPSSVECLVVANPQPTIYWFYKNCQDESCDFQPQSPSKLEMGIVSKSYLNIAANQSGYVKCIANNSFGMDESIVGFFVTDVSNGFEVWGLDKNTIEDAYSCTSSFQISVGETITLYCAASLYNYTDQFTWYKNGHGRIVLENDDHYTIEQTNTKFSNKIALLIHIASFKDSGTYTCQTEKLNTSVAGAERFRNDSVTVTVRDLELPIIIQTNLNDTEYSVNYPDRFQLWCYAKGVPKPTITWYKDEKVLELTSKERIRLQEDNRKLIFERIEPADEGSYMCRASNKVGTDEKQMKILVKNKQEYNIVLDKPGIKYIYVLLTILAMTLLFIPLFIYLFVRFRKERELRRELKKAGLANFEDGALETLNPELGIEDQAELLPYDRKWEFSKEKLKLSKKLGSGAFGVVMKAEAVGITEFEESTVVAVKMAKRSTDYTFIKALASELKIMVHLGKHLNVVNLLGACTKNIVKGELLVIVEYCRYGNLHNHLLRHRECFINQINPKTRKLDYTIGADILERGFPVSSNGDSLPNRNDRRDHKENVKPICTKDLIIWAFQVARGMEYLASRKVLHGDLAARNILLADYNVVKICDFGLAKSLYKSDNYKKKKDALLPLKWMAVESIKDRVFSTHSDIWSFGVVLWEFFSLACTPYPGMEADEQLCNKLLNGYRMDSPEFSTNEIYKMMLECWHSKPLCRPSFSKLVEVIGCILGRSEKQHYADLNDPYLLMNTQRLENGQSDYLAMLSSPDFGHAGDDLPNETSNTKQPVGYLCMKPSHTFSPQVDEEDVFTCDVENCNRKHKNSNGETAAQNKFLPVLNIDEFAS